MTETFYEELDALYQTGDKAAVEAHIRQRLDTLRANGLDESPEYAAVLNELAGFYRGVSRYDESLACFEKALEIFRMNGLDASPEYATILMNLAGLYRLTGRTADAVEMFLDTKKRLADSGLQHDYLYASVLNNLSLAYQDAGSLEKAYEASMEAYEMLQDGLAGEHELATSSNNLAVLLFRMKDYRKAEEYADRALEFYDAMAEENVHHASALSTKASLLYRAGRREEALRLFLRALSLTERFFGQNLEYAVCSQNIAAVYETLGDNDAAAAHLGTASAVFEKLLGPSHPRTNEARTLYQKLTEKETGA